MHHQLRYVDRGFHGNLTCSAHIRRSSVRDARLACLKENVTASKEVSEKPERRVMSYMAMFVVRPLLLNETHRTGIHSKMIGRGMQQVE